MTLSHYNHIHMQSCYHLYSSRRTNYPGRVGKLALHYTSPPDLNEVLLTRRLPIPKWWWFLGSLGSSRVVEVHTYCLLVALDLVSYYHVHLYQARVFPFQICSRLWFFHSRGIIQFFGCFALP